MQHLLLNWAFATQQKSVRHFLVRLLIAQNDLSATLRTGLIGRIFTFNGFPPEPM